MTAIKICGITREADALAAAHSGANAIGLVFYGRSPRHVTPARAAQLLRVLPPFVTSVGLFVDAAADDVRQTLAAARVDLLQFHGDESPGYCGQFGVPYLKAVRVRPGLDLLQYALDFRDAKALLISINPIGAPKFQPFLHVLIQRHQHNLNLCSAALT